MYMGTEIVILLGFIVFGIKSFGNFRYRATKVFYDDDNCEFTDPIASFIFKTLISCTVECSGNENCRRVRACNVDTNVVQCHLYYEGENCVSQQPENCTCMSKTYGTVAGKTFCPLGLYGSQCENTIRDCSEGHVHDLDNLFTTWVRAYIKPSTSSSAFEVVCELRYNGMTLFMARNWKCQDINFNRNITEYVDGFGDVYGDHWLGLKKIKEILGNHPRHKLSVILMNNDYCENYYDDFSIGSAANWYPINFGQYMLVSNKCGDSFTGSVNIEGSSFSARGKDLTAHQCSTVHQGGWWYVNTAECSESSFMGSRESMYWPSDKGSVPQSYVGMRILPY